MAHHNNSHHRTRSTYSPYLNDPVSLVRVHCTHAGCSSTPLAETFHPCPPVALVDEHMPQCHYAGWIARINSQPIPSTCLYLWTSPIGWSPTLLSAYTFPTVSFCGPPWWAFASVWTCWLERTNWLSADTFYTWLSVALLDGPIPYIKISPYHFYGVLLWPSWMGPCVTVNLLAGA